MKTEQFTLYPRMWYALEYISDTLEDAHRSPIYIFSCSPKKSGKNLLTIEFFHANYPVGVQRKVYDLRVIKRVLDYLIADRVSAADENLPTVILSDISFKWLKSHFPKWLNDTRAGGRAADDGMQVQKYLTGVFKV